MTETQIRNYLQGVGLQITEAEGAHDRMCPECADTLRPLLRSLDALYEALCRELAIVRSPFAEAESV